MNLNLFIGKKLGGKSAIATVSVALSLAVTLTAISVSGGFKREIIEKAVAFSGEIMLTSPGEDPTTYQYCIDENLSFLDDIRALDEVSSINGVAYTVGMFKTSDAINGALFKGITTSYDLKFFAPSLKEGRLPNFDTENASDEILISQRMADAMKLQVGDRITAYFIGDEVRARKFTISGIYDIQLEKTDETLVICDRRQSQQINGWGPSDVSCMEITLKDDRSSVPSIRRAGIMDKIDEILYLSDDDEDSSLTVDSIDDVYGTLFDWLGLLDMNVLIILVLMMVVAGFNMVSGLLIILFRNISTIGLLKSLGMRTSQVCKVFLWKAMTIVLCGMAAGDIFALLILSLQKHFRILKLDPSNYFVDHVPVWLDAPTIIIVNIAAFVIMMLIMTIPCKFISGVSPSRTIRTV